VDGAQSSRVPVPLPDDPYVAVRQARLVDTDTESDREEASSKAEESQPFGSRVPLITEEFEAFDPSGTRTITSHSPVSLDSTAPLSPDHPLTHVSPTPTPNQVSFHHRTASMPVRTQPTLSLGMSARIAEAAALSPSSFRKRYRSSYETPSPSSSPTLPVRKRYRGTSKLILDTDSEGDELGEEDTEEDEKDESLDADDERERERDMEEEEEAALGGQQQVVLVVDTAVSEPLGLGYGAARCCALESTEEISPSTYELGQSFRVYTDIPTYAPPAAPVQTPPSPEWSLGAQLELHGSILHDHTQRLDALPHTLFEVYDRDLRELYTRSWVIRDEIFSHRYRFRSLEREQERAMVIFSYIWRPVLALEAWAGQTDAQRAALWHAIYDIQRENHDLRRQLSEERRERLELTYHVARMERRQEFRGD
nr:hypothetical protein [Tanacetum cinerariifolium]